MLEKKDIALEATDRFNRIVSKFILVKQRPHQSGTGEALSSSKVHLIAGIGQMPLSTVTEQARFIGVTKGAYSQLAGKLAKEGYITKMRTIENNKEVRLILTKKGEIARAAHDEYHRRFLESYSNGTTIDQISNFNDVLKKIETYVDDYLAGGGLYNVWKQNYM